MELLDGVVQLTGDVVDGLRGIGLSEHRLKNLANLAGRDAAQESLANQFVDRFLAAAGGG